MKSLISFLAIFLALGSPASGAESRILMLVSSHGSTDQPDLSYDLEELAQAYLVLHDNGVELDIASPRGGAVLVKTNKDDLEYIQRFKSLALAKLQNTKQAASVQVADYDGVFIVGGGGAMMDLPFHAPTQALLGQFVAQEKIITAVCHGPAAIADIKRPDGTYFVADKTVNSFTNIEERAFSKESMASFSFLTQDRLTENGGRFVHNKPMLPFVAIDQNLITAQNPSSVARAAEASVLKLGLPIKPRDLFKDEATMELVSQARSSGSALIDIALAHDPEQYDLNYLALYGFYAYSLAADEDKQVELDLMTTIGNHFQHAKYDAALIERMVEQGRMGQAEKKFTLFKQRYPEDEQLEALSRMVAGA